MSAYLILVVATGEFVSAYQDKEIAELTALELNQTDNAEIYYVHEAVVR